MHIFNITMYWLNNYSVDILCHGILLLCLGDDNIKVVIKYRVPHAIILISKSKHYIIANIIIRFTADNILKFQHYYNYFSIFMILS